MPPSSPYIWCSNSPGRPFHIITSVSKHPEWRIVRSAGVCTPHPQTTAHRGECFDRGMAIPISGAGNIIHAGVTAPRGASP